MRVAIAGFGVEGRASYDYWHGLGAEVAIADERQGLGPSTPSEAELVLGPDAFKDLGDFDLIIRSPSVNPAKLSYSDKVWSATNEFFSKCPVPIIGVTGTKGKGTTCSLIASILRKSGKTVHLVGNIGSPALDILPSVQSNDIVVYELSSFQLWDLKKSPHIAVVLGIEPDHLDVHEDFEGYVDAKANIRRYQDAGDLCLYHPTNQFAKQIALSGGYSEQPARRYAVPDDGQVYVSLNNFCVQDNAICGVDTLHIAGPHNIENACAAISASLAAVPELTSEQIADGLADFKGLPHRLKFVDEVGGVKYYDDSIATTPGSAIAALRAFVEPKIIILGGSSKGAEYEEIISVAKSTNSRVIAIGQTGQEIYELCQAAGVDVRREHGLMRDVVPVAASMASPGDIVILSPASASFDQYSSYADRGEKFIEAVGYLKGLSSVG